MESKIEELIKRIEELERQILVVKSYYLGHSKGGSSRNLTNRYNELKSTMELVKEIKKDSPEFVAGFKLALDTFEKREI